MQDSPSFVHGGELTCSNTSYAAEEKSILLLCSSQMAQGGEMQGFSEALGGFVYCDLQHILPKSSAAER